MQGNAHLRARKENVRHQALKEDMARYVPSHLGLNALFCSFKKASGTSFSCVSFTSIGTSITCCRRCLLTQQKHENEHSLLGELWSEDGVAPLVAGEPDACAFDRRALRGVDVKDMRV